MLILSSAILGFFISAHAQRLERQGDLLWMRGESCEAVSAHTQSLRQWALTSGEATPSCPHPPVQQDGSCVVEVTQCLPAHVRRYEGAPPAQAGPNCWNLALVMSGILPGLRYATPEEMTFFMGPPLCRPLALGEARRPGDVGAIRDAEDGEVHGFIWISDTLTYSKNGMSTESAYRVQPLAAMMDLYQVEDTPACRGLGGDTNECGNRTQYYRCMSTDEYLAQRRPLAPEIRQAMDRMDNMESCLERYMMGHGPLTTAPMQLALDSLYALNAWVNYARPEDRSPEAAWAVTSLSIRLESMFTQFNLRDHSVDIGTIDGQMSLLSESVRQSAERLGEQPAATP